MWVDTAFSYSKFMTAVHLHTRSVSAVAAFWIAGVSFQLPLFVQNKYPKNIIIFLKVWEKQKKSLIVEALR